MGRTKIDIDPVDVNLAIATVESAGPMPNLSRLFIAVSASLETKYPRITPALVRLRVMEHNIPHKTLKGKMGNPNLGNSTSGIARTPRKVGSAAVKACMRVMPENRHRLVKRMGQGSLKAAIKLKCLDCANHYTDEIRHCPIVECPLWSFRPFQKG